MYIYYILRSIIYAPLWARQIEWSRRNFEQLHTTYAKGRTGQVYIKTRDISSGDERQRTYPPGLHQGERGRRILHSYAQQPRTLADRMVKPIFFAAAHDIHQKVVYQPGLYQSERGRRILHSHPQPQRTLQANIPTRTSERTCNYEYPDVSSSD